MEKRDLSDTANRRPQDEQNDLMALFPTDKVFGIALDYLHNDKKVQEFVAYMQSEEFPMIHAIVEYLQEYKDVSAFVYMNLQPQFDRENICLVSTGG